MTKKAVFNRRFAQLLCKQGFKILEVQPNNNKPWMNVYYFEHTPELIKAFNELITNNSKSAK